VTLIDQRILIDAPPQVIWEFLSDPAKLPHWHAGYASVSVLTTQQTGAGTRRRCTPAGGGKDFIEEITAWIDGLGYEYTLIEGGPYRSLRGRIRLQPGPDGTSVQWTIDYQPKGLAGFIRNIAGGHKQLARMMATSLRELRQQVNALGLRLDDASRARVGIQERLNAAERQQYQRRYAPPVGTDPRLPASPPADPDSSKPATPAMASAAPQPAQHVPAPRASAPAGEQPVPANDQPSSRQRVAFAPPATTQPEHDIPLPPPPENITPPEPMRPVPPRQADDGPARAASDEPDYRRPTPPRGIPSVRPAATPASPPAPALAGGAEPSPQAMPARLSRQTPPHGIASASQRSVPDHERAGLPPPTPQTDTGELSIWDVFGLSRPSEEDEDALKGLIQSVEDRKSHEQLQLVARQNMKFAARVRRLQIAAGLRLQLALKRAGVRLPVPLAGHHESK